MFVVFILGFIENQEESYEFILLALSPTFFI